MPLTKTGNAILNKLRRKYGDNAEHVFYGMINEGKPGSEKWHEKKGKKIKK